MKHLASCALLIATAISACSQKISSAKVPQKVRTAFEAAHPNVEAKWEKEGGDYEVSFKEAGSNTSCVLNEKGLGNVK